MTEIEKIYGIPKEVEADEELYMQCLMECDFSDKLIDGRSSEDKEGE